VYLFTFLRSVVCNFFHYLVRIQLKFTEMRQETSLVNCLLYTHRKFAMGLNQGPKIATVTAAGLCWAYQINLCSSGAGMQTCLIQYDLEGRWHYHN